MQAKLPINQLSKRQRKLLAGYLVLSVGRGGVQQAAFITGLDHKTVQRGKTELLKWIRISMQQQDLMLNQCGCDLCRLGAKGREHELHACINLLMSIFDEQERRWFAAYLALQYESVTFISIITGLSEKTIRKGIEELSEIGNWQIERKNRHPRQRKEKDSI